MNFSLSTNHESDVYVSPPDGGFQHAFYNAHFLRSSLYRLARTGDGEELMGNSSVCTIVPCIYSKCCYVVSMTIFKKYLRSLYLCLIISNVSCIDTLAKTATKSSSLEGFLVECFFFNNSMKWFSFFM